MLAKRRISLGRIVGLVLLAVVVFSTGADTAFAFRFGVMADSEGDWTDPEQLGVHPMLSQLITEMNVHDPAFCLFPGDLGYGVRLERQWAHWKDVTSHFTGKMYVTPGNRDAGLMGLLDLWREAFPDMPQNGPTGEKGITYYFDHGNSRFISVCTDWEDRSVGVRDKAWLNNILDASTGFEHVFVYSHHPGLAGEFQMLVDHGVNAFFCGHLHRYEARPPSEPDGTWEFVVGTAGHSPYDYLIVEVDGPCVEVNHYRAGGVFIDSFTIATPEPGTMVFLAFGAVGILRKRRR